ncbi:MAG: hypothetical protein H0V70_12325 [Ktedonobacteraceae bacterium]|nr:hypothetical protein [Ktedonobacteraceae bacterium]
MDDNKYFDDKDENIFSDEDISYDPSSKAPHPIPSWLMAEFLAWMDRFHPKIRTLSTLSRSKLGQLVREFEAFTGYEYDHEVQDWQRSLRER